MDLSSLTAEIWQVVFQQYATKISVSLGAGESKGANFDKFRNTGKEEAIQSPIYVLAMIRPVGANSLIIRDLGLTETGSINIVVKDSDAEIIKAGQKITIEGIEYTPWNDALGNRFQIFPLQFRYTRIILFRKIK